MSAPAMPPPTASWRLWAAAALGALLLHASGIALALEHMRRADDEDAAGAQAIEIGLEFEAPKVAETDLPPGPEADAAAAAPEIAEQKVKTEETDLPKEQPAEAEDADRAVSPTAEKKPEDTPDLAAVRADPSQASQASEAAAPAPSQAAQEGPKFIAPTQGVGDSARRAAQAWQRQLVAYLDRHKRYPPNSRRRDVQLVIAFRLDRLGHIATMSVAKSSGDPAFDDAALAMLRRSDPAPAPPPLVADQGLSFTLPVVFRAKGRS